VLASYSRLGGADGLAGWTDSWLAGWLAVWLCRLL